MWEREARLPPIRARVPGVGLSVRTEFFFFFFFVADVLGVLGRHVDRLVLLLERDGRRTGLRYGSSWRAGTSK